MFQTLTLLREHPARNKNNAEQNVYSMINLTEVQWPNGPHAADLENAVAELNAIDRGRAVGFSCDVRVHTEVRFLFENVIKTFQRIDVLVNNAGIGIFGSVEETSPEDFRAVLETNLFGVFYTCHEAIPLMKQGGGGYIFNISSLAGVNAHAGMAAYNASKFGLNGFSEALMQEVRHDGIKVSYIMQEVNEAVRAAFDPETYRRLYSNFADQNPLWNEIPMTTGSLYQWEPDSTYIREPPYFDNFKSSLEPVSSIKGARALAIFGDSVTTDHISPAGAIKPSSPAGLYLQQRGVDVRDFNSYGARRGNHEVMVRGTFANVRIKNLMVPGVEGGVTIHQPDGERMSIYDAAMKYQEERVPLVIVAGQEYGTGSSRDWAAKGTRLLGVKAVIAQSFERIHRSNLVGMGVLPCQFKDDTNAASLNLDGSETFKLVGIEAGIRPLQALTLLIHRADGKTDEATLTLRIDTPIEVDYYQHGGILPFVLRQLLAGTTDF